MSRKKLPPPIRYRNPERVMRICSWCRKRIAPDSEIFSLNAKVHSGIELEEQKGVDLYLFTLDRVVSAIAPANDSQAKKEGNDLWRYCKKPVLAIFATESSFRKGMRMTGFRPFCGNATYCLLFAVRTAHNP